MKTLLSRLFISAFVFCSIISANAQITLHTIGDSTMANYDPSTSDIRGWGMMFQQFFNSGVVVNNRGKSGSSSKSFYMEAPYWTTVKQQIKAGDYVIIQFAHNDEKNGGLDGGTDALNPINGTDYRGTNPQTTYKDYLRKYIDETRALNATPILATSICRKYFSGGTITRTGLHDLGTNFSLPATDHTYDYVYAMKEVAVEKGVQLIDLTTLTKNLVESYGDAASTAQLYVAADSTHPTALLGTLTARLCAQEMIKQNILASYINTSTDVLINPVSCDFGDGYTGQTLTKELTITGLDLVPVAGTFTFSVNNGFLIAANKTDTFGSSINMNYTGGNLAFTKFYISTTQAVGGTKTGTLTVANGTVTKTVPLTANFIQLTGGTEVSVIWSLTANTTPVLLGPATVVDQSFSAMNTSSYAVPSSTAIWPAGSGYDSTRKTQRNVIDGSVWPAGEIDEVSTRYIQFGIKANAGTELNIDLISLYVGGSGGNGMRCRISYSKDDFTTTFAAGEFQSMVSGTMNAVSKIPVIKLVNGETLKLRVYPWYNGTATGKTICLSDVKIHGVALPAVALSIDESLKNELKWAVQDGFIKITNAPLNSKITIYDLSGRQVSKSSNSTDTSVIMATPKTKGIYIGKVESQEGTQTIKFLVP
ncbi:Por secretion system C-terminal sorting domain-containing protein [Flavobacterium fluvii]|uniref:Por secretion system C-terminal sorting domain-containing protein n=1 Tax=Flavobacterium fluvii TaxID=468056 RepID=A0A1M5LDP4_9FLAO|nr:SGNH/GDSL hydrolase family protein [Flavobacterium fluvii]SHG63181.1 Por secretion system C-terminal sorting domain-containing protein [Flavobacterium fluvii]